MKKSGESVATTKLEPVDLDFDLPDWSGMRDNSSCGSADHAFKLCEEYVAMFPVAVRNYRKQARIKCEVEFVL